MKTRICLVLLALVASQHVYAQNEDEIPVEADNQFPPDANSDTVNNVIEGSGSGPVQEPVDAQVTSAPLEAIESRVLDNDSTTTTTSPDDIFVCPTECICNTEETKFVVDCSNYGLTQFPSPIDSRTTVLNLQNNKLTEIPNTIASLTNLKTLNAENNEIMEIQPGSISELPELITLNLRNNRLIEYPKDLKNGFALTKLQEIDLGGNDMRTTLSSEYFSIFKSLTKLTLPSSGQELLDDLCISLGSTLKTVCSGTCTADSNYDCPDAPQSVENGILDATLASSIPVDYNNDPIALEPTYEQKNILEETTTPQIETTIVLATTTINPDVTTLESVSEPNLASPSDVTPKSSGEVKEGTRKLGIAPMSAIVNALEDESAHDESNVKIGATTSETNRGGIDNSIIGLIVAGMIVVVAGIVLKKNWSSIKKRFSSSPRTPNERAGGTTNGTVPEEVPLQDKSPV